MDENEIGKKLKSLKSNNGGEYCSREFDTMESVGRKQFLEPVGRKMVPGTCRKKNGSWNPTRKWCV